ncbi:hypothetical protein HNQ03_002996 [Chryseobacterium sp. 16F]|uniref:Uncharacterized protein n=1 Tax=Frigoriflavimonas asaccharolytica TaxID=2735899 RepID=A0A8J8GAZ9_9FLAO|nr:hypothetical protein [Frigoriflavimonas asaccharolytica]
MRKIKNCDSNHSFLFFKLTILVQVKSIEFNKL